MTNGERDPAGSGGTSSFGAMLKARLDELRWSGRQLAGKGLNQQTVRNMLSGRKPRIENVLKVAEAFDDDVNTWLKAAGYPEQDPKVEETRLLRRIEHGVVLLTSTERRVLARMIEGILIDRGYVKGPAAQGDGSADVVVEGKSYTEPGNESRVQAGPVELGNDPLIDPDPDRARGSGQEDPG